MQMANDTCGNISSNMLKIALKEHHFKPYFQQIFDPPLMARPYGPRKYSTLGRTLRAKSRGKQGRKIKSQNEGGGERNQINARIYSPA